MQRVPGSNNQKGEKLLNISSASSKIKKWSTTIFILSNTHRGSIGEMREGNGGGGLSGSMKMIKVIRLMNTHGENFIMKSITDVIKVH